MLTFEPLCRIEAQVGELISVGHAKFGERRFVPIIGGAVRGAIEGEILDAGGGDWQILRSDGVLDIEAHYMMRLAGNALVEVLSQGYRHGPPEVMARLAAGEAVAASEYFFRTTIRFQTGATEFLYLNRTMAIASGSRTVNGVSLDVYRLL